MSETPTQPFTSEFDEFEGSPFPDSEEVPNLWENYSPESPINLEEMPSEEKANYDSSIENKFLDFLEDMPPAPPTPVESDSTQNLSMDELIEMIENNDPRREHNKDLEKQGKNDSQLCWRVI
jgi:hypothetical protein